MLPTPTSSVLCVDDDLDACEMLSELLRLSGIKAEFAPSACAAWKLICAKRFELYVLDAWLPDLDGFEFCRQIRTADLRTPILFYSGAAYDSDKRRGLAAGANAYVVKPDVEGLVEAMSGLIVNPGNRVSRPVSPAIENLMEANRRADSFKAALRTGTNG